MAQEMPTIQVSAADLDVALIKFGDQKLYKLSKLPYVPVTYEGKVLRVKTPTVRMPFGVSNYKPEGKDKDDISIPISFEDTEPVFFQKMQQLDERVLDTAVEQSQKWFGKQKSRDTLDDNHNKIVKVPKVDKMEYGRSMKVKWPGAGQGEPKFWEPVGSKCRQVDKDVLVPHCTGKVIMELRPLYQVQGKFGLKWVVKEVLVVTKPEETSACGFGDVASQPTDPILPAEEEMEQDEEDY